VMHEQDFGRGWLGQTHNIGALFDGRVGQQKDGLGWSNFLPFFVTSANDSSLSSPVQKWSSPKNGPVQKNGLDHFLDHTDRLFCRNANYRFKLIYWSNSEQNVFKVVQLKRWSSPENGPVQKNGLDHFLDHSDKLFCKNANSCFKVALCDVILVLLRVLLLLPVPQIRVQRARLVRRRAWKKQESCCIDILVT
jgi:hypothetical protein